MAHPTSGLLRVASALIATTVVAYGLYLLLVGQALTDMPEGSTVGMVRYEPTPSGLVPLVGGSVILAGLLFERPLVAWVGLVVIAAFSVLFVFGIGGASVPVFGLLAAMLAVWHVAAVSSRPSPRGRPTSTSSASGSSRSSSCPGLPARKA